MNFYGIYKDRVLPEWTQVSDPVLVDDIKTGIFSIGKHVDENTCVSGPGPEYHFEWGTFRGIVAQWTIFENVHFKKCLFEDIDFRGQVFFDNCVFESCSFRRIKFGNISVRWSSFSDCRFTDVIGREASALCVDFNSGNFWDNVYTREVFYGRELKVNGDPVPEIYRVIKNAYGRIK